MARRKKGPWKRNGKGPWYTTVGRQTIRVADDGDSYDTAFKKWPKIWLIVLTSHPMR